MSKSIILIHGLFMSPFVMRFMDKNFKKLGYSVYHFSYKTVEFSDQTLADLNNLVKQIKTDKLHIVGHSMGGLVARQYVDVDKYKNESHKDISIVTVGTPHHTSRLGTYLQKSFVSKIFGSSGKSGIVDKLPAWKNQVPLGCIAGVFPIGLNTVFMLKHHKGLSDGTVFLDEAIIENCTDSLTIKSSHTGLVYNLEVIKQCDHFFNNHKFNNQSRHILKH